MRLLVSVFALILGFSLPASGQTASEIPLENPEVLTPPTREEGVSPRSTDVPESDKQASERMTVKRMAEIVMALDENATFQGSGMVLTISDVRINIVTDPLANRMRAFAPFRTLDGVNGQELYRMMQANFDSALDARYAIARGYLISVFIHPLGELQKDQFIEGLGQVVNLVKTFGSAYTSGAMTFRGGDSNELHRQLIDDLLKKGEEI